MIKVNSSGELVASLDLNCLKIKHSLQRQEESNASGEPRRVRLVAKAAWIQPYYLGTMALSAKMCDLDIQEKYHTLKQWQEFH